MSEVLTIVGASARAAAASAARAGFLVRAADLFADLDLRCLGDVTRVGNYPAGLKRAISGRHGGDWMYTGALENAPELVERWSRIRPLLGNPAAVLRRVRQPQLVERCLRRGGLCAPAVEFDQSAVARDARWLSKSLRSSGGAHVAVWDQDSPADWSGDQYFQQHIDGMSCSAAYVAARGQAILLGVTRQLIGATWTAARGFQYCGSIGPLAILTEVGDQFVRVGNVLAREFGLLGLFGVDAIVNDQGVWPVEVNPRYTASMELFDRAFDLSTVAVHVDACRAGRLPRQWVRSNSTQHAKAILFAGHKLTTSPGLVSLAESLNSGPWPLVADIPPSGSVIEAGWPLVTIFSKGSMESVALESLRGLAATVRRAVAQHDSGL